MNIRPDSMVGRFGREWQINHIAIIFAAQRNQGIFSNLNGSLTLGFNRILAQMRCNQNFRMQAQQRVGRGWFH